MSPEEWERRQKLVDEINFMIGALTLTVCQEEGRNQNAYEAELQPDGRIVIWTE